LATRRLLRRDGDGARAAGRPPTSRTISFARSALGPAVRNVEGLVAAHNAESIGWRDTQVGLCRRPNCHRAIDVMPTAGAVTRRRERCSLSIARLNRHPLAGVHEPRQVRHI
jgi:hypothetical protein